MSRERPGHTLQTTALVNEAYLRLVNVKQVNLQNRAQFFGLCAWIMRNILVDFARSRPRSAGKREPQRVSLDEALTVTRERSHDLVSLDEALEALTETKVEVEKDEASRRTKLKGKGEVLAGVVRLQHR